MSLPAFFLLNGIGALLFVSVPVVLGWIFQNAITDILFTLADIGKFGVLAVLAALGLYLLARWWRRQAFIRQLQMDRISVDELRALIDDGQKLLILDVRPKEARTQHGIIPGAVPAHPEDPTIEKIGDRVIETLGVSAKLQASLNSAPQDGHHPHDGG